MWSYCSYIIISGSKIIIEILGLMAVIQSAIKQFKISSMGKKNTARLWYTVHILVVF